MKRSEKEEKIKVRVVKKPSKKRTNFQRAEPQKEINNKHHSPEEKNKKNKILLIIGAIMIIIFIGWVALLGNSFSRIENEEPGFLQKMINDLKDEFNEITNSFNKAKSDLTNESELSPESDLEENIFPETK